MDLLIGVDNADLHYSFVDIRGKVGEPVARLGPLGWTYIGPPDGRVESGTRTHTIRTPFTREVGPIIGTGGCCELGQTLKRFWEIESYGTELCDRIVCTEEENVASEKVSSSVRYNNGRYNPVALVCDIQEMYLQIEIEAEDRPLFRILWRDETDCEMKQTAIQMCTSSAELSLEKTQRPCKPSLLRRSMLGVTKLNIH